jgi:hypothetical protein
VAERSADTAFCHSRLPIADNRPIAARPFFPTRNLQTLQNARESKYGEKPAQIVDSQPCPETAR